MKQMRLILTIVLSLSLTQAASAGSSMPLIGPALRLEATTVPSVCRDGDLRNDTAASNAIKVCKSNTWNYLLTGGTTNVLPISKGGTAITNVGAANQLIGANSGTTALEMKGVTVTTSGTLTIPSGQTLQLADGTTGAPGITFSSDTDNGIARHGADDWSLVAGGFSACRFTSLGSGLVNMGCGAPPNGSSTVPLVMQRASNGALYWTIANTSTGTSMSTVFQVGGGTGSNYATIENFSNNTTNTYLGGGSLFASSPNQGNLVHAVESTNSAAFMGFDVGGRTLASERMRLSPTTLTLNGGVGFRMQAATSGSVSFAVPATTTSYTFTWPAAVGNSGDVLTLGLAGTATFATPASAPTSSQDTPNCTLAASASSNTTIVSIKDASGADPSAGSPCKISFRNSTATTGTYSQVSVTAATSVTISNGSSMGCTGSNLNGCLIYAYAINNAGTVELGVINGLLDEGTLQSSTAEGGAGAADSADVLYSTTARSSKAVRLLGRINGAPNTSFAWSSPTEVSNIPVKKIYGPTVQKFTATGTTTGYLFTISTSSTLSVGDTYTNNGNTYTVLSALTSTSGQVLFMSGASAPTASGTLTRSSGGGTSSITFTANVALATYTTPAGVRHLRVRMVGAGGGGGGGGSTGGGSGNPATNTFFGPNLLIANGGGGGGALNGGSGGSGGSASIGSGNVGMVAPVGLTFIGSNGLQGVGGSNSSPGGAGGATPFGGPGPGAAAGVTGLTAKANTGSGGGGGGGAAGNASNGGGAGGGAGGFLDVFVTSPYATYPYVVGTGGTGGTAGTSGGAGGVGADGIIEVEEYY